MEEKDMNQHIEYHYSVTIETDDEAFLHCLRALSQYAQITGNKRISWGGTKKEDWERDNHCVKFHFSKLEYREKFINEVSRLFPLPIPNNLWKKIKKNDNDPATIQS